MSDLEPAELELEEIYRSYSDGGHVELPGRQLKKLLPEMQEAPPKRGLLG
jgi:hypothetical protein